MRVSKLVEYLQRDYAPETELIVAYWDKETVENYAKDLALTDDQWSDVVDKYDDGEYFWQSSAAENLVDLAHEVVGSSEVDA
jgi:hypothetical protein